MSTHKIAYLGPVGTYSHLVAEKRFGRKAQLIPMSTIYDVCSLVARKPGVMGIVPIENSSGGAIYETVDILMANKPKVQIDEEISLNVKLALLGRKDIKIRTLYSHFAPLEHCAGWIKKNLPRAQKQVVSSTAAAALRAASESNAAALGNRKLASLYYLDILKYPVEMDIPNITTFLVLSNQYGKKNPGANKTTVAVRLPNKPGSLCTFLDKFRSEEVNLSRIISRPIRGSHKEYAFLVDLEGSTSSINVKRALESARKVCVTLRVAGAYPCARRYQS